MRVARSVARSLSACALLLPAALASQAPKSAPAGTARVARPVAAKALPLKFVGPPTTGPILARDLMSRLYRFADDSMMGRMAGTVWNDKGTDFIAAEVKRLGLEPAGENGTYFQSALVKREIAPTSTMSVGGTSYQLWKEFVPRDQGVLARPIDGALAIFGGTFNDTASYLPVAQAAGKVVVFRTGRNPDGTPNPNIINRGLLTRRYLNAAAIVVVSVDYISEDYITSVYRNTGVSEKQPEDTTSVPQYYYISSAIAKAMLGVDADSAKTGLIGNALQR